MVKTIPTVTTGVPAEVTHSARGKQQKAFYQVAGFLQYNDSAPYSSTEGEKCPIFLFLPGMIERIKE